MVKRPAANTGGLTRRALVTGLAMAFVTPAFAAEHPSVTYMKKVAKDMLNAHRQGTVASFKRAIQRHQRVYATLGDKMKTDEVHALSMKAFTPAEWAAQKA